MNPKRPAIKERQQDLFHVELTRIIDRSQSLMKLAVVVDWEELEKEFGTTYCPDNGRPGISTRMMMALHYLK